MLQRPNSSMLAISKKQSRSLSKIKNRTTSEGHKAFKEHMNKLGSNSPYLNNNVVGGSIQTHKTIANETTRPSSPKITRG